MVLAVVMFRGDMDALARARRNGIALRQQGNCCDRQRWIRPGYARLRARYPRHVLDRCRQGDERAERRLVGHPRAGRQPAEELVAGAKVWSRMAYTIRRRNRTCSRCSRMSLPFIRRAPLPCGGLQMAGTDQLDVIIHGVGGHGSAPQRTKEPIVMGAMAVMAYQTLC